MTDASNSLSSAYAYFLITLSDAFAMAIVEPTSVLWFFWEPASCVLMDEDIWFQISGLTLGMRRPSTFSGRKY